MTRSTAPDAARSCDSARRLRRRAFDTAYEGTPSWEIGRPQPAVVRLVEAGELRGSVLDLGCGSGAHAVLLARHGRRVVGLDVARRAIGLARARATEAGVAATFVVGDALDLGSLGDRVGAPFDAALDVGLFHVLQPDERRPYAVALAAVLRPGGTAVLVCWSDRNPFGVGPARVSRREIRAVFRAHEGWAVESIEPDRLETRLPGGPVHAWLARIRRR